MIWSGLFLLHVWNVQYSMLPVLSIGFRWSVSSCVGPVFILSRVWVYGVRVLCGWNEKNCSLLQISHCEAFCLSVYGAFEMKIGGFCNKRDKKTAEHWWLGVQCSEKVCKCCVCLTAGGRWFLSAGTHTSCQCPSPQRRISHWMDYYTQSCTDTFLHTPALLLFFGCGQTQIHTYSSFLLSSRACGGYQREASVLNVCVEGDYKI